MAEDDELVKELTRMLSAQAVYHIEREMHRQNKTIDDMVKPMGMSKASLRAILSGKKDISLQLIAKFTVVLNARAGIILGAE